MPVPVKMPKLGMTMTEGTLVRWLVAEGDAVEKSQVIAEVETDKLVNELESPGTGTLTRIGVDEGELVDVAHTMAWILQDGESAQEIPVTDGDGDAMGEAAPTGSVAADRSAADAESPEASAAVPAAPCGESRLEPWSSMRAAITRTVTASAAVPQIVLYARADASRLQELRKKDHSITFDDAIVYCVGRTLTEHETINASFEEQGLRLHRQANVGFAVAIDAGMMIPVIRGVERLSLRQISDERASLVERVRTRTIDQRDLAGGTFSVTNLGMYPVDRFSALVHPPQAGILSVGRIQQQAIPDTGGGVTFVPMMELGLTLDHRVADGAAGAAFLKDMIQRIETIPDEAT